ncbi:MAG: hypothetical protein WEC36_19510, partial [Phycisphaeraceae bacterium]
MPWTSLSPRLASIEHGVIWVQLSTLAPDGHRFIASGSRDQQGVVAGALAEQVEQCGAVPSA